MVQSSQVLLAVAQGAFIMTPEWVTASLEAGHWLPEDGFISKVTPTRASQPVCAHKSPRAWADLPPYLAVLIAHVFLDMVRRPASRRLPSVSGGSGCCPGRCRHWSANASTFSQERSVTLRSSRACGRLVAALGAKVSPHCPSTVAALDAAGVGLVMHITLPSLSYSIASRDPSVTAEEESC